MITLLLQLSMLTCCRKFMLSLFMILHHHYILLTESFMITSYFRVKSLYRSLMNTKKDTAVFHIDHVYEIDYSYPGVSRLTDDDDAKPFPIDTLRSAMESICPSNFKNEEERRAA